MAKDRLQTRADNDTVTALEKYVEDDSTIHDTKSGAVRHFIRAGLAGKGYPVAAPDGGMTGQQTANLETYKKIQNGAILTAGAYVVAAVTMNLTGPLWLVVGLALFAANTWLSYHFIGVSK